MGSHTSPVNDVLNVSQKCYIVNNVSNNNGKSTSFLQNNAKYSGIKELMALCYILFDNIYKGEYSPFLC